MASMDISVFLVLSCYFVRIISQEMVKAEDRSCPSSNSHIGPFGSCLVSVRKNETVTLKCTFEKDVNCAWTRRGFHVDIHKRYSYESGHDGHLVHDCSIKIDQFKPIDAGEWICKTLADSSNTATVGANISLAHLVRITKNPKEEQTAKLKESITLNCEFDTDIYCTWYHNDSTYFHNKHNDYDESIATKNCSLTIQSFSSTDTGKWKCSNKGNDTQPSINSTEAFISRYTEPKNPRIYLSQNASIDEGIVCVSEGGNPESKLLWMVDGEVLDVPHYIVRRHTHEIIYDSKIILNYTHITYITKTSKTLSCVCTQETGEMKDEIEVYKIKSVMLEEPNANSTSATIIVLSIVVVFLSILLVIAVIYILKRSNLCCFKNTERKDESVEEEKNSAELTPLRMKRVSKE